MNQTTLLNDKHVSRQWWSTSAKGKVLGTLAVSVATALMGRRKRSWTPSTDNGDFVVVTEVEGLAFTGRKTVGKLYSTHSGYVGGLVEVPLGVLHARHPERVFELAVRRMLPKTIQGRAMLRRLKVYKGAAHPHTSQKPAPLPVA